MKVKFKCVSMDTAGALHNAFLDALRCPEGFEPDITIGYGRDGWEEIGHYVTVGEKPIKEKAPEDHSEA